MDNQNIEAEVIEPETNINEHIEAEVIEPETNINEQIETEAEEPETNINEQIETVVEEPETNADEQIETEVEEQKTNTNEQTETNVVDQKSNKTEKKTRNKIKNDNVGEKYEEYKELRNNGVSIKDIKKQLNFSNDKMSILDLIYEKEKDGTLYSNSFLMKYLKNKPGNKTLGQVKDKGIFIPFHVLKKINADEIFSKGTYYSYDFHNDELVLKKK